MPTSLETETIQASSSRPYRHSLGLCCGAIGASIAPAKACRFSRRTDLIFRERLTSRQRFERGARAAVRPERWRHEQCLRRRTGVAERRNPQIERCLI